MRIMKTGVLSIALIALLSTAAVAIGPSDWYNVSATAELGVVKVLSHTIQLGASGTAFDYVEQGGQEILFPFKRTTAELNLYDRHDIVFLYQPLTVETKTRIPVSAGPLSFDGNLFVADNGLNLKYGFDFWRLSYLYRIVNTDRWNVGAGVSLQLRNASIVFESTEGDAITVTQNLGPVPILKARAERRFVSGLYLGTEVDGFYASSAFFNGSDFEFEGSILDASIRAGLALTDSADVFANLRFLGGTAKGTSEYDTGRWTEGSTNYTENYLSTLSLTLGARLR